MEFNESTNDKIDRYLNNEMTGEELVQFESEKNANKSLAAEVEVNAQMKELLADTPENKLRQNLESLSNAFEEKKEDTLIKINRNSTFNLFLKVAAAIIISGMLWWVYNTSNSSIKDDPQIVETPLDPPPDPKDDDSKIDPIKEPKDPSIVEEKEPNDEISVPDKNQIMDLPSKKKETTNIYAANFKPNPSLEFLIDNNLRGNDLKLEVTRKIGNISLSSLKDVVEFRFSGIVKI